MTGSIAAISTAIGTPPLRPGHWGTPFAGSAAELTIRSGAAYAPQEDSSMSGHEPGE